VHPAASGDMVNAYDASIQQSLLFDTATHDLALIVHNCALGSMDSGMDTLRTRRMRMQALARHRFPPRGLPLPFGVPVLTPLCRNFALGIDRGDTGKTRSGDQGESRIRPTIQTPHIVCSRCHGPRGRPPWKM
jgi:hypothetical protein